MKTFPNSYSFVLVLIFLVINYISVVGQNQDVISKLTEYNDQYRPDKIYIHTDQNLYAQGDTIWFNSYLLDGIDHCLSRNSKVVYVELIDPNNNIISKRKLYVTGNRANGEIPIGELWKTGEYLLRGYTNYMRNEEEAYFFRKTILIWDTNSKITEVDESIEANPINPQKEIANQRKRPIIRFYPESGNLIAGIQNTVGIKSIDSHGNGIKLKGRIEDLEGNKVSFFQTFEMGLGSFHFTPISGKEYLALITINGVDQTYNIPLSKSQGSILNMINREDHIVIKIKCNQSSTIEGMRLIGHLRGDPILNLVLNDVDTKCFRKTIGREIGLY
jgi:hypothetical protein